MAYINMKATNDLHFPANTKLCTIELTENKFNMNFCILEVETTYMCWTNKQRERAFLTDDHITLNNINKSIKLCKNIVTKRINQELTELELKKERINELDINDLETITIGLEEMQESYNIDQGTAEIIEALKGKN